MWDANKYADMRASHLACSPFFPGAPVLLIDSIYLLGRADIPLLMLDKILWKTNVYVALWLQQLNSSTQDNFSYYNNTT